MEKILAQLESNTDEKTGNYCRKSKTCCRSDGDLQKTTARTGFGTGEDY